MDPLYIFFEDHDLLLQVYSHIFAGKNRKVSLFFSNFNDCETESRLCLI